jgi:hypothetical protein
MSLVTRVARALLPAPLVPAARRAAVRAGLIEDAPLQYPFRELLHHYPRARPNYRWGCLCAAFVARELGLPRISVIEFGVAGGDGLLALEQLAAEAEAASGVAIDVYGFDTGTGLTKPQDYRDLPQLWFEGDYVMDVPRLKARLHKAQLVLGPVAETVPKFLAGKPAPIGFVSFDLDLYSSTMDAFRLFDGADEVLLPRVVCYFDDIVGYSHGDFNGERLAITEFNQSHEMRKISKIYGLRYALDLDQWWVEMMYMFHAFRHPRYNDFDGTNPWRQIPLQGGLQR